MIFVTTGATQIGVFELRFLFGPVILKCHGDCNTLHDVENVFVAGTIWRRLLLSLVAVKIDDPKYGEVIQ